MAECKTDLAITSTWHDAIADYADLGGEAAFVQNKSTKPIVVNFSASGSAPSDGSGLLLPSGEIAYGTADHIWIKALGGITATVAVGLAD